jgi:hypothetical protein
MTPPKPVDIARWLWIGSAVLGTVRFLVQLADREMLTEEVRRQQPNLGQDQVDAAVTGGIFFGFLLASLLVLVYTVLANRMAGGRNWARVVLTVLGGAGVFFGAVRVLAVGSGVAAAFGFLINPVDLAFGVVTMIIDAVAIVLMHLPSVRPYFRRQRTVNEPPHRVANGL